MTIRYRTLYWAVHDEDLGVDVARADTEKEAKYLLRQIEKE